MLVADQSLEDVVFFIIDQSMRKFRQYSAATFAKAGFDITVDQWLVLKRISDSNGLASQTEIADMLGKDNASITRIIDILVKKHLLIRQANEADRRRFELIMTDKGISFIQEILPLVKNIRTQALHGISDAELLVVSSTLKKLASNVG